jgi:hypothetical protein
MTLKDKIHELKTEITNVKEESVRNSILELVKELEAILEEIEYKNNCISGHSEELENIIG